ncbi:hypothetical protein AA0120_g9516 [Alternaria tenuissima]|nr:hypothetical protein AA0120_g9516 [Alternaria tenuissima]
MEPNQAKVNQLLKWLDDGGAEIHTRPGSERLPGPFKWIPETSQFESWLSDGPPTLLLVGRPGSGKTIAASLVVDTLLHQDNLERRVGVAFLHVGTGERRRNGMQLSRSLLYQLGQQLASSYMRSRSPPRMEDVLDPLRERNPYPSMVDMVSQILPEVISKFDRVYVVVDELDQMTEYRGSLRSSLVKLRRNNLRLFLTTRHSPGTKGRLHKAPQISIAGANTGEDLDTYVTQRLADLPRFVRNRPILQTLVKERVIEDANGLILAAKLLMDGLMNTRGARIKLRLTSTGDLLGELYDRFIARIQELDDAEQDFAKETLAWLLLVKRPMREAEMRHILQRDQNTSLSDADDAPDYEQVLELCEDFNILVDVRGGNCLDVHPPASDYLLRTLNSWCPDANMRVAKRCLVYLILEDFKNGPCKTDVEFESRLEHHALYEYTAQHWAEHLHGLQNLPMDLVRLFLLDEEKIASATQVISVLHQKPLGPGYSQKFDPPGSGFHVAARLGLTSVLASLLGEEQQWLAMVDTKGRTPLWCAIENDQQETMEFLSRIDRTTFTLLLDKAQTSLANTLLRVAATRIKDLHSNTALHIGVMRQDLEIMRLSLNFGVDVDAKGVNGYSAIGLAIKQARKSGQVDAIHLLLEHSASTAQLRVSDWEEAFEEAYPVSGLFSQNIIELSEYETGGTKIGFFSSHNFDLVDHPVPPAARRLLIYCDSGNLPKPYLNSTSSFEETRIADNYAVTIIQVSPDVPNRAYQGPYYRFEVGTPSSMYIKHDGSFGFGLERLMISWNVGRLNILKQNGGHRYLIRRLLNDATTWINFRHRLLTQVEAIRKFCNEYENQGYEDQASKVVVYTISDFEDVIKSRFDEFDAVSSALIQLFIFLPLTFVAGLFGMNVNILADNPPWWWYLVFMFLTLSLTMLVWLTCRKFPDLEDKVNEKFPWLKPDRARQKFGPVE